MYIVVIYGWKEVSNELLQAIARAIGITAFEVQQRMIGDGPSVIARFADLQQAQVLAGTLNQIGIATLVVDVMEFRSRTDSIIVRRFELTESSLNIETRDSKRIDIPYSTIDVLLPGTNIVKHSKIQTITERKFSLGKTILTGGLQTRKKIEYKKDSAIVQYGKVLYLYSGGRQQPVIFSQDDMTYDGLGAKMQISRGLNFTYLKSELHRLSPGVAYDDRLSKRIGQIRLLGSTLNPETNLDLAAEILSQCLR
ncbi:hypothetical protein KAR48_01415 [bacterium]|nr:hypothetical protein [bacterium]